MRYNQASHSSRKCGIGQAEERTSSFPLRIHSIHVPETPIQTTRHHPLSVIVLLVPAHPANVEINCIEHLKPCPAPRLFDGSAPGLGYDGCNSKVGGEPVLKDAAIDLIILEDSLEGVAEDSPQVMFVEKICFSGEITGGKLVQVLSGCRIYYSGLIDERPCDQHVRGDIFQFFEGQTETGQMLSIYVLRR